ncbi:acid phosphatase [Ginsengibacter hankyongi]|uniref:Acid phosphatase n=1 Tax=Ginsengibacter hankyongi TaxID=2607284 RepID=A0A5J5IGZ6_9BACT|nr:alkaline phosphatase family protein [Ginsengibacter hankyongi]KAA9039520.1 acid phosphatase [Ginsengibacter hankyongi]
MKHLFRILLVIAPQNIPAQIPPTHIVIVIFENQSVDSIVGNPAAPYINSLLNNSRTASLIQSYSLTHPSQPNYISLFSGSSQGATDDNIPDNLPFTAPNIGAELINNSYSFIGYSENLPYTGSTDSVFNGYARKHNPWANWQGSSINGIPATSNRAFTDFPVNYSYLPTVSFVIPTLYNDMHDGSISTGDEWLKTNLDGYIEYCLTNNSLFILTFDEDNSLSNNHILTFFTGEHIVGGRYGQMVTHYNVLRTIEEFYSLSYAGASADSSAIKKVWQTITPVTYTFIGNGNWDISSNWQDGIMPPNILLPGNEIIVDPQFGGQCIVNVPYTVSNGAMFKIIPGKNLIIESKLIFN